MQNKKTVILYLYAETTVHAGTGTGLGAVDLPIQREKHTDYPIIQTSGVKGAIRHATELRYGVDSAEVREIFGGPPLDTGDTDKDFAGAISPSDARILCFPVRALRGVFVWVTSPSVLARFARDVKNNNLAQAIPREGVWVSDPQLLMNNQVMLEEYAYPAQFDQNVRNIAAHIAVTALNKNMIDYWHNHLETHLVILPDDDFRDFAKHSTDIVTRIHMDDEAKIVKEGQLFTQELLPADSILYSVLHITASRSANSSFDSADKVWKTIRTPLENGIQIGADETVGRGRFMLNFEEMNDDQ